MKEVVVLSGKGGTGKTSLTASLAILADNLVLADCDVDAADLHLVLAPEILHTEVFTSGHAAHIQPIRCSGCGICEQYCQFDALRFDAATETYWVDDTACEGCGVCVRFCPEACIDFPERACGHWFISATRAGPMVHARLGIGAENSGKLVTRVREEAKHLAQVQHADWLLIDGPPGIGCAPIASMTGTDCLVLITEPSLSGRHDVERVLRLASYFGLKTALCVNKWDINPPLSAEIEQLAVRHGAHWLGNIRYDRLASQAQLAGKTIIEMGSSDIAADIGQVWHRLQALLNESTEY